MKESPPAAKRAAKRTWFLRVSPTVSSLPRGAVMRTASAAETGDARRVLRVSNHRRHLPQQLPPRYKTQHSGRHCKTPRHHKTRVTMSLEETARHPQIPRRFPALPRLNVSGSTTVSPRYHTRRTRLHHRYTSSLYRPSASRFHR